MKILENKFNENKQIRCDACDSLLEFGPEDMDFFSGYTYITCPCCGHNIIIDSNHMDDIMPTPKTVTYPKDFMDNSTDSGAVVVSDNEIQKYMQLGLAFLRENKEEFAWYAATGDTFVVVFRCSDDEEYYVVVAHGYQDCHVAFLAEDYE